MNPEKFLNIKEASQLTGKADITIRRLIKRLSSQNNEATNQMIRQKKKATGYVYEIYTGFLLKELNMADLLSNQTTNQKNSPPDQVTTHLSSQKSNQGDHLSNQKKSADQTMAIEMLKETIGILREQLNAKDGQLADKHAENQELIRGNRESIATVNVLTLSGSD